MSSRHKIKSNIIYRCIDGNSMKLRISLGLMDDYKSVVVPIRAEDKPIYLIFY